MAERRPRVVMRIFWKCPACNRWGNVDINAKSSGEKMFTAPAADHNAIAPGCSAETITLETEIIQEADFDRFNVKAGSIWR